MLSFKQKAVLIQLLADFTETKLDSMLRIGKPVFYLICSAEQTRVYRRKFFDLEYFSFDEILKTLSKYVK